MQAGKMCENTKKLIEIFRSKVLEGATTVVHKILNNNLLK
jgi:hypothetical protein